tara:strand:- start:4373 stop:5791 length:1419 start_codon:yes stop_codon:yes gene_type:complete
MAKTPLVSSADSLTNISKSLTTFASSMSKSSLLARNIAKSLNKDNIFKNQVISDDESFFVKRRQSFLRRKREEEIEANSTSAIKAPGKAIKNAAKGFLGRLMDFFALTMLGWAIFQIPKIIKGIGDLINRMGKLKDILAGFISGSVEMFNVMAEKLDGVLSFIFQFDFEKDRDEISKNVDTLNRRFGIMTGDLTAGINEYVSYADQVDKETAALPDPEDQEEEEEKGWFGKFTDWAITPVEENGDVEDTGTDEVEEVTDEFEGIETMATGGLLKKGETAVVGDDPSGQGKESKELIVADSDLQVIPNNILGALESISSNISGEKTKEVLVSNQNKITKEQKEIALYENLLLKAEERLKQYIIDDDVKRKAGVSRKITFYKNLIASKKKKKKKKMVISPPADVSNFKEKLKVVTETLQPERKSQIITVPIPTQSSNKQNMNVNISEGSGSRVSRGVNIKEYYKHLSTLITAYT